MIQVIRKLVANTEGNCNQKVVARLAILLSDYLANSIIQFRSGNGVSERVYWQMGQLKKCMQLQHEPLKMLVNCMHVLTLPIYRLYFQSCTYNTCILGLVTAM